MLQVGDGVADVDGLVEELQHLHARGEQLLDLRQGLAYVVHHLDRVGPRCLLHGQGNGRLAVHPDDVGLLLEIVHDFGHVPDVDRLLADVGDDDVLDGLDQAELGLGEEAVVEGPGLDVPRGKDQVGLLDRLDNGLGREVEGLQPLPVEVDLDLPDLPASDPGGGDVGDVLDLRLDHVVRQVVELPLGEPPSHQGDEDDRDLGDVEFADDRGTGRPRADPRGSG